MGQGVGARPSDLSLAGTIVETEAGGPPLRASIMEPCRRAVCMATSQKSLLAERENEREKGTGAPRSARLKGQTRGPSARFQPAAGEESVLLPQLAILCAARLPSAPSRPLPPNPPSAPAKFLSCAAKSFSRAPNRFLTRLFEELSPKSNPEQTPPNPSSAAAPSTSPYRDV